MSGEYGGCVNVSQPSSETHNNTLFGCKEALGVCGTKSVSDNQ
ncbi:unnamed protein product [Acanthoscelides obtectus]|uniref:Uncharacterized protein n=1 Tax=Acanthoscelides obtectus TaxID=200917 RepID=A0A9P0KH65_ACAOB|nr:unnamed protein product [Acanthoscelides obtectus]CAK1626324.1 hypothetical protein AOBTE_LOCUS3779 [Acanthoscelides obtectus]